MASPTTLQRLDVPDDWYRPISLHLSRNGRSASGYALTSEEHGVQWRWDAPAESLRIIRRIPRLRALHAAGKLPQLPEEHDERLWRYHHRRLVLEWIGRWAQARLQLGDVLVDRFDLSSLSDDGALAVGTYWQGDAPIGAYLWRRGKGFVDLAPAAGKPLDEDLVRMSGAGDFVLCAAPDGALALRDPQRFASVI